MKTPLIIASILFASLAFSQSCKADFVVKNNSDETIKTHVLFTFVERDGFVYQKRAVTLRPGQKHIFKTGHIDSLRTVYLFVKSETHKRMLFDHKAAKNYRQYQLQTGKAPYWRRSFDSFGNKFVASEAAEGRFAPLCELKPGYILLPAMIIKPTVRGSSGFEYTYHGIDQKVSTRLW